MCLRMNAIVYCELATATIDLRKRSWTWKAELHFYSSLQKALRTLPLRTLPHQLTLINLIRKIDPIRYYYINI